MGIQAMKTTGNSKLLQGIHLRDCISYVLSLPVHCLALGCIRIEQLEDDVRIAQRFKPLSEAQMAELCETAAQYKGPQTEDWKRDVQRLRRELTGTEILVSFLRRNLPTCHVEQARVSETISSEALAGHDLCATTEAEDVSWTRASTAVTRKSVVWPASALTDHDSNRGLQTRLSEPIH